LEELKEVQSLECHLVVPSSGEHPANLQALIISSPPSFSPPGTIPVHSNCPFAQLFLLLVSKLLDAGTIVHYFGFPGRCQRLSNRHSPGGVSCFTGSAPRPSKQGAPPPTIWGLSAGQGTSVRTLTQHGSSPSGRMLPTLSAEEATAQESFCLPTQPDPHTGAGEREAHWGGGEPEGELPC